jgi:hypothetical protein
MALNVNSGLVNVTGTVTSTAGTYRPNGFLSGSGVTNTTSTLGTVGAGKKWTILSFNFGNYMGGAFGGVASLKVNGQIIALIQSASSATNTNNEMCALVFPYSQAPQIAAGQTVQITADVNSTACACVTYIEESA